MPAVRVSDVVNDQDQRRRPYGLPLGSVMRFIAEASFGSSQRTFLVSDIASTIEDETPILVM